MLFLLLGVKFPRQLYIHIVVEKYTVGEDLLPQVGSVMCHGLIRVSRWYKMLPSPSLFLALLQLSVLGLADCSVYLYFILLKCNCKNHEHVEPLVEYVSKPVKDKIHVHASW